MEVLASSSTDELTRLSAVDLAALTSVGEVSCREVVEAHLARISEINPTVNAVCTVTEDVALLEARQRDDAWARGEVTGILHGIPLVHKDLIDTAGIRTTYGSRAFAEHVPETDNIVVQRTRAAGAVTLGKSNTPQFGTGGHTSNEVFGTTRNPVDTQRSAGGSSGGSAAAVASGMAAVATGTDMAGSLRIPAAFCGVVGMRPSPGVVPWLPTTMSWFPFITAGPMARSVDDAALLLAAMAGDDPRSPIAGGIPPGDFVPPLSGWPVAPGLHDSWRVAWAPHLGGLPVDSDVDRVLGGIPTVLASIGVDVVDDEPDMTGAHEAFWTWRCWYYATAFSDLLRERPDVIDDSTRLTIEGGQELTGAEIGAAERARSRLIERVGDFFTDVDILLVPSAPVAPFAAEKWWPEEVGGRPMESYADWMRHFYYFTAAATPSVNLPAGFTDGGLPVGVQVIAANRRDRDALAFASLLEENLAVNR